MDDRNRTEVNNPASAKEKAEGSRENVNLGPEAERGGSDDRPSSAAERGRPREHVDPGMGSGNPMERGGGQVSRPEVPLDQAKGSAQPAAGITNRPIEEEEDNQQELPPRGKSKSEERP